MNDKKQIEEIVRFIDTHIMAKKIAELIPSKIVSYDGRSKGQHLYIEQKMEIAKEMMKQGVVVWTMDEHANLVSQVRQEFEHEYKDKVVLTMEEFDEFRKDQAEVKFLKNQITDQARKETAKELLTAQLKECIEVEKCVLKIRKSRDDLYYNGFSLAITNLKMYLKELAREYKVEVE